MANRSPSIEPWPIEPTTMIATPMKAMPLVTRTAMLTGSFSQTRPRKAATKGAVA
jgi:hypothetical protein